MASIIGGVYTVLNKIELAKKKGIGLEKIIISGEQGSGGIRCALGSVGDVTPTEFYIKYEILYNNGNTQEISEKQSIKSVNGKFCSECGEWASHLQHKTFAFGEVMRYMIEQANELRLTNYRVEVIDRKDKYTGK
ncbi:MAG: hypothetical protein KJ767_00085 [Nanoarchaeota archaeon]|nr:hypothetical protein [Nanoarchaeota archaeon]